MSTTVKQEIDEETSFVDERNDYDSVHMVASTMGDGEQKPLLTQQNIPMVNNAKAPPKLTRVLPVDDSPDHQVEISPPSTSHTSSISPLYCDICGLLVHTMTSIARAKDDWVTCIVRHSKLHTWVSNGEFMCVMGCEQTYFDTKTNLTTHYNTVHAEDSTSIWNRPIAPIPMMPDTEKLTAYEEFTKTLHCQLCDLNFDTSTQWQCHMVCHNPSLGDGQWACKHCPAYYADTLVNLRVHHRQHHAHVKWVEGERRELDGREDERKMAWTGADGRAVRVRSTIQVKSTDRRFRGGYPEKAPKKSKKKVAEYEDTSVTYPTKYACLKGCTAVYFLNANQRASHHHYCHTTVLTLCSDDERVFDGDDCRICGRNVSIQVINKRRIHVAQHIKSEENEFGKYPCLLGCNELYLNGPSEQRVHHRYGHVTESERAAQESGEVIDEDPDVDESAVSVMMEKELALFDGDACRLCPRVIKTHLSSKRHAHIIQHSKSAINSFGRWPCRLGCHDVFFNSDPHRRHHHLKYHQAPTAEVKTVPAISMNELNEESMTVVDGGIFDDDMCTLCERRVYPCYKQSHIEGHNKSAINQFGKWVCLDGCPRLFFRTPGLLSHHKQRHHTILADDDQWRSGWRACTERGRTEENGRNREALINVFSPPTDDKSIFNGEKCTMCPRVVKYHLVDQRDRHMAEHEKTVENEFGRYPCERGCTTLYLKNEGRLGDHYRRWHGGRFWRQDECGEDGSDDQSQPSTSNGAPVYLTRTRRPYLKLRPRKRRNEQHEDEEVGEVSVVVQEGVEVEDDQNAAGTSREDYSDYDSDEHMGDEVDHHLGQKLVEVDEHGDINAANSKIPTGESDQLPVDFIEDTL